MSQSALPTPMKDGLAASAIDRLARSLKRGYAELPEDKFRRACLRGLTKLELKARVAHLVEQLARFLPEDFRQARLIVLRTAAHWDPGDPADPLRGFAAWPLIDWVAFAGMNHPRLALGALRDLTSLFSAEFAIRPFLIQHTAIALPLLEQWTRHRDPHVRRLVSEGTRPRLPWGVQLRQFVRDPSPCLPLLDALKDDSSPYVRRSVANHLNDITKDHPDIALRVCSNWTSQAPAERKALIAHALRTLVKRGDPQALNLLGYTAQPEVAARLRLSHKRLTIGSQLTLAIELRSTAREAQALVIDYAVVYCREQGNTTRKVFKGKTLQLEAGQEVKFSKTQHFRDLSTRKHFPGPHQIELLVSGHCVSDCRFDLCR